MELYRGLSFDRGQKIVSGREAIASTSNGEFGKGSYYWKDDLPAAIISAAQYYGTEPLGWAVINIEVSERELSNQINVPVLDFHDDEGTSASYDPTTSTAARQVAVGQVGRETRNRWMTFEHFRDVNASPDTYAMVGEKNKLEWPDHPVISGPTAASPKDSTLRQIKFSGNGLDILNGKKKTIVISGKMLNAESMKRVRNWTFADRRKIYQTYFFGKHKVDTL